MRGRNGHRAAIATARAAHDSAVHDSAAHDNEPGNAAT